MILGTEVSAQGSIIEHVYNSLLKLYHNYVDVGLRGRILQCLGTTILRNPLRASLTRVIGFLFRAQPALMTAEPSAADMDAIFAAPEEEGRARLLRILQDFLVSEAAKHAAKEKGEHGRESACALAQRNSANARPKASASTTVDMEELVGNTDGFAESGWVLSMLLRALEIDNWVNLV